MNQLKNSEWWNAALIRALKTICQTLVAMIGTSQLIESVDFAPHRWGLLYASSTH